MSIYYKDNPNLTRKIIKTFDGSSEYRANCKKIKGEYYVINKDCFEIEGTCYRLNSGLIVFDYESGKMVVKKGANLIHGVVSFERGAAVLGYFTPNPYRNCDVYSKYLGGTSKCINDEVLIGGGYAENFSTGVWYSTKEVPARDLQRITNAIDNTHKGYNIEDNAEEFSRKIELYEKYSPELTKDVRRYGKMLSDTTFGIEIEACKGYMPENIQNRNGIVVCRDGSLVDENGKPGPEFVTVPMSGAKGLQTISNISKELSKRTVIDLKCSLHIHLGNLPTTRMYLISLYRLCNKLQSDVFQMFPFYKANPEGIKKKNYNQKLPALDIMNIKEGIGKKDFDEYVDDAYNSLFSWLSEGYYPDKDYNRKLKRHPVQQKWNRHSRYYWVNFMNTIFSERNTVEFRIHTPTTNQQKIVNWLFICNAIVKYANNHASKLILDNSQITLNEVLDYYSNTFGQRGRFLSEYLKAYVKERKDRILLDIDKGDKLSIWDIEDDKNYVFNFNGVTNLF